MSVAVSKALRLRDRQTADQSVLLDNADPTYTQWKPPTFVPKSYARRWRYREQPETVSLIDGFAGDSNLFERTLDGDYVALVDYAYSIEESRIPGDKIQSIAEAQTLHRTRQKQAIDFSGTSIHGNGVGYLTAGDVALFDFDETQDFSFEVWCKFDGDRSQFKSLITKGDTSGATWALYFNHNNETVFVYLRDDIGNDVSLASDAVDTAAWNHYAITVDRASDALRLYVNGIESTNSPLDIATLGTLVNAKELQMLSADSVSLTFANSSLVDEIRIWSDVRTGQEILNNKDAEINPASVNLIGYWKCNGTPGVAVTTVSDETTNGNDLTASGGLQYVNDSPFYASVNLTDSQVLAKSKSPVLFDTFVLYDDGFITDKDLERNRLASDDIILSDDFVKTVIRTTSVTYTKKLTDNQISVRDFVRANQTASVVAAETFNVTDDFQKTITRGPGAVVSRTQKDDIDVIDDFIATYSQAPQSSTTYSRTRKSDIAVTDDVTATFIGIVQRTLTDSMSVTDANRTRATATIADAMDTSDSATAYRVSNRLAAESVAVTDDILVTRSSIINTVQTTDSLSLTDFVAPNVVEAARVKGYKIKHGIRWI